MTTDEALDWVHEYLSRPDETCPPDHNAAIALAAEVERLKIEKARLWESLLRLNRAVPMTASQTLDGMMMIITHAQWDELTAASEQIKALWEKAG